MSKLVDKVAIVTGASKGIGAAIARQLGEAGATCSSPAVSADTGTPGGRDTTIDVTDLIWKRASMTGLLPLRSSA